MPDLFNLSERFEALKNRLSVQKLSSNLAFDDESLLTHRGRAMVIDRVSALMPYGHEVEPGIFTIPVSYTHLRAHET